MLLSITQINSCLFQAVFYLGRKIDPAPETVNFKFCLHCHQYGNILSFLQFSGFDCLVGYFQSQQLLRDQVLFWIGLQLEAQKINFKWFQPCTFWQVNQFSILLHSLPAFGGQRAEMLLIVINCLIKLMQSITASKNGFHSNNCHR